MNHTKRFYTVQEASTYMGLGATRVWCAIKSGHLNAVKLYGSTRIESAELDRYADWLIADNGKTRATDKLEREPEAA